MKRRVLLLILLVANSSLFAQQWKPVSKAEALNILSKMKLWYKEHPDYSVKVNHTSYIGYSNTTPHEQSEGYLTVRGKFYHSNMLGIETIQNAKYKITIDTSDKNIIISNPDDWNSEVSDLVDSNALRLVTSYYLMKHDNLISIRLDYKPGSKLERHEITLNSDYRVSEIAFYFSRGTYDETSQESENEKPKVVVKYSDYKLKDLSSKDDFDSENYIVLSDSNKLKPALSYSDFQLFDSRINR